MFNSKEYAWIDVNVVMLGKPVAGLRGIEYKIKHQKEALFGTGKKARGIQFGKKEYEGTITVLQSEINALHTAAKMAGHQDLTDLEFDVIISYMPNNGVIQTDKIINVSITETPSAMKEGDLYQEIALPFIACDMQPNI